MSKSVIEEQMKDIEYQGDYINMQNNNSFRYRDIAFNNNLLHLFA